MRDLSQQLESRLANFVKDEAGFEPRAGRAAVAIMVREARAATEMLMIRRATREGDPWSGHMGFPGGRRDAGDPCNFPVPSEKPKKKSAWIWLRGEHPLANSRM